jgi:RNase P/RNase MRP subunit p30
MRKFVDFCIVPTSYEDKIMDRLVKISKLLDISLIGISFHRLEQNRINEIITKFNEAGIDIAKRIDITPKTRIELLRELRKNRGIQEIICVNCNNTEVSIVASRDRRVDLISIGQKMPLRSIRKAINRISNKHLEIRISEILTSTSSKLNVFRKLYEEVSIAKYNKVPIILSSGAKNSFMMRSPRDIAALGIFLGLDKIESLNSVSKNPISIIKENRKKLSNRWVTEGVEIYRVPKK